MAELHQIFLCVAYGNKKLKQQFGIITFSGILGEPLLGAFLVEWLV